MLQLVSWDHVVEKMCWTHENMQKVASVCTGLTVSKPHWMCLSFCLLKTKNIFSTVLLMSFAIGQFPQVSKDLVPCTVDHLQVHCQFVVLNKCMFQGHLSNVMRFPASCLLQTFWMFLPSMLAEIASVNLLQPFVPTFWGHCFHAHHCHCNCVDHWWWLQRGQNLCSFCGLGDQQFCCMACNLKNNKMQLIEADVVVVSKDNKMAELPAS